MNNEQIRRVVEIVKATPGISLSDIDAKLGGVILGIGSVKGISEREFDENLVGPGKPLSKVEDRYYIA